MDGHGHSTLPANNGPQLVDPRTLLRPPPALRQLPNVSSSSVTVPVSTSSSNSVVELHPDIVLHGLLEDSRPYSCDHCSATYKTRTHLRRHLFIHLKARPFPCTACGKGFNRKEHLFKHAEAVHSGTKYKCNYCYKEISRKDHLNRHIKNMHTFNPATAFVAADGNKNTGRTGLNQATLQFTKHLTPSPRSRPIKRAGNAPASTTNQLHPAAITEADADLNSLDNFFNGGGLDDHWPQQQQQRASGGQGQSGGSANSGYRKLELFQCVYCTSNFTSDKDLELHTRTTHKSQPFKCPDCTRAYTRREKLTEHIRCFHQGLKFTCDYCGKDLSRKDHVLRHIRSVHPEVLANRFVEIAERESNMDTSETLESPSGTASGAGSQSGGSSSIPSMGEMSTLLRSVCSLCLKVFGTSYHLGRHIQSCHSNNSRPFACTQCDKQFKRKDHLVSHMRLHCHRTSLEQQQQQNARSGSVMKSEVTSS